ncbi:MAG: hypothetical protein AAF721_05475 [Myxococcota bacterium]
MVRSFCTGLALVLLAAAPGRIAQGAPEATVPEPDASTIVVLPSSPKAGVDDAPYTAAIRDHAASVGLDVAIAPRSADRPLARALEASRAPGTLGVFWLERRTNSLTVYLYQPRVQGVFIREVARGEGESDAALVESVGLIVASTATALRQGGEVGMRALDDNELAKLQPEPEPEPQPEPVLDPVGQPEIERPVDPPPPSGLGLRFVLAYLGDGFNTAAPWQSGVRVGVGVLPHPRVRVGLGYGWLAAQTVGTAPTLRLARHEVTLDIGVGGDLGDRISLHGSALMSASLGRWRSEGLSGLRPIARPGLMLELGVRIVADLYFDIGIGAAATLNRVDFVVCDSPQSPCTGEGRNVVATPWSIAPRATAGLSYRLGGAKRHRTKKSHPTARVARSLH